MFFVAPRKCFFLGGVPFFLPNIQYIYTHTDIYIYIYIYVYIYICDIYIYIYNMIMIIKLSWYLGTYFYLASTAP